MRAIAPLPSPSTAGDPALGPRRMRVLKGQSIGGVLTKAACSAGAYAFTVTVSDLFVDR